VQNEYGIRQDGSDPRCPWPGDVIDIGGHIGSFSYLAATAMRARKIVVVEPDPDNYALLQHNLGAQLATGQVVAMNLGIGPPGSQLRTDSPSGTRHNTGGIYYAPRDDGTVETTTLDALLELVQDPILLKLDCEGCEYTALLQSANLQRVQYVIGEYHEGPEHQVEQLAACLESRGFSFHHVRKTSSLGLFSGQRREL
jgi:FkbM family methyltransferase